VSKRRASKNVEYDVNYGVLDAFKRKAMQAASENTFAPIGPGFREVRGTRGESAYLLERRNSIYAFVVEGLGTLSEIAKEMLEEIGISYMEQVSRANFATIANDLAACGAEPLVANSFISVGNEGWFKNPHVRKGLIKGWMDACKEVGCVPGGGETQKLRDIVHTKSVVLGGAALGIIEPKSRCIKGNVKAGDRLVMIASSGIHANGITMARDVARKLKDGFLTRMPNTQLYGDALLRPKHVLYGPVIQAALNERIAIHYVSNITGHGWRKVMRLEKPFTYFVNKLPVPQPVFDFIQKHSGASDKKMYGTFNMGAGCLLVVPPRSVRRLLDLLDRLGYEGLEIGYVKSGPRRVIMPRDIGTFKSDEYQVR